LNGRKPKESYFKIGVDFQTNQSQTISSEYISYEARTSGVKRLPELQNLS